MDGKKDKTLTGAIFEACSRIWRQKSGPVSDEEFNEYIRFSRERDYEANKEAHGKYTAAVEAFPVGKKVTVLGVEAVVCKVRWKQADEILVDVVSASNGGLTAVTVPVEVLRGDK